MVSITTVLDSRLEALVFDYVSFGIFTIINNLWTCVAVVTAAVSFWRYRAAGAGTASRVSVESEPPSSACIEEEVCETQPVVLESSQHESATESSSPICLIPSSGCEDETATKGKFVVYYREDDVGSNYDDGEVDDDVLAAVGCEDGCNEWWEKMVGLRMADLGWYSYQDLTVINGNVVRLWDGVRRRRHHNSGCVVR